MSVLENNMCILICELFSPFLWLTDAGDFQVLPQATLEHPKDKYPIIRKYHMGL